VEDWKNGTLEYCKVGILEDWSIGKSEHHSNIPTPQAPSVSSVGSCEEVIRTSAGKEVATRPSLLQCSVLDTTMEIKRMRKPTSGLFVAMIIVAMLALHGGALKAEEAASEPGGAAGAKPAAQEIPWLVPQRDYRGDLWNRSPFMGDWGGCARN
jgi:hypothetical protein